MEKKSSSLVLTNSTKDEVEKTKLSDSEVKRKTEIKRKKGKFVDHISHETIYFDPNDKSEMNAILDRINYVKDALKSRDIKKVYEIEIKGETFNYERHDGGILIKHPVWSLMGFGENLYPAEKDLYENMREVEEDYLNELDSCLTDDAIALKKFLFNALQNF